ncbi:MAG: molybdopterin-dependent oxidoreductase [Rhodocyclaceae bacterium]|nr:molybdopterin-dependent oxidoreductase [Rhodocyclaceae bacterium]
MFAEADHVVGNTFRWNRVGANPTETFGCICQWDTVDNALTCYGSYGTPRFWAMGRAMALNLPTNKVKVIPQPQGGAFGGKGAARHRHRGAVVAQGGRASGEVHRRPHGISPGRIRTVLGSPLRCGPGRQGGWHGDRFQGAADRRSGRGGRGLGHYFGGQAAGGVHRFLSHRGGAVRHRAGRHQPGADRPLPRLRPSTSFPRAGVADGHGGAQTRHGSGRTAPPQLYSSGPVSLYDPQR